VKFVLQQNTGLTTSNWTDVTIAPMLNTTNLHHEVTVPRTPSRILPMSALAQVSLWLLLAVGPCCLHVRAEAVSGTSLTNLGTVTFDRNNTFGWRFTPTIEIEVTALGFFDATSLPAGTGTGLTQPHDVGIYRVSDQLLVASNTIPAGTGAVLAAHFRYATLPTPVRLAGGTTYLMAGFALSASPDPAAATGNWTMAPGILYANSPLPTVINPTSGTSQYLVSAHGNPPPVLTYPGVAQTAILPVFAADFQFTPVVPFLTGISFTPNSAIISVTNLTVGATNFVEKSTGLGTWQTVQTFVPSTAATNLSVVGIGDSAAFYRIRVGL
jgi:hypothetical protein